MYAWSDQQKLISKRFQSITEGHNHETPGIPGPVGQQFYVLSSVSKLWPPGL